MSQGFSAVMCGQTVLPMSHLPRTPTGRKRSDRHVHKPCFVIWISKEGYEFIKSQASIGSAMLEYMEVFEAKSDKNDKPMEIYMQIGKSTRLNSSHAT